MKYEIVYNFNYSELLGLYMPEPVTCSLKKDGRLDKRYKLATPETLAGLSSVTFEGTPHARLLEIAAALSEEQLSVKFKPKGKRKVNFKVIQADKTVYDLCAKHISRKVAEMLQLCYENGYPVTVGLLRKEAAEDFRYTFSEEAYNPRLKFAKHAEGIDYTLYFETSKGLVYPFDTDTIILTNHPAWVIMENKIIHLDQLNGNKLKPFLKKTKITIPQRTMKVYFEKFIMDLVPKVKIDTDGFEIENDKDLKGVGIELVEDVFTQQYLLRLHFQYSYFQFRSGDPGESKTTIHFSSDETEVLIINQLRDKAAESKVVSGVEKLGATKTDSDYFLVGAGERSAVLKWLGEHKKELIGLGLTLEEEVGMGSRSLSIKPFSIEVSVIKDNDWFDVGGVVRVGKQDIPFVDLINNIKNDDPYFLLSDGTYFVIPEEWMAKYGSLAKFGQQEGGRFKLAKNHIGLLEDVTDDGGGMTVPVVNMDLDTVDYKQSDKLKATLRPYQVDGIKWLIKHQQNDLGACLADDMGLGKTLQVIAALVHKAESREAEPVVAQNSEAQLSMFDVGYAEELSPLQSLIVVPASLVHNWKAELHKFAPHLKVSAYIGAGRKERQSVINIYDVVITTYQTALRDIDFLQKKEWTYVVLDESHYIKNRNSKIFKALAELRAEHKISLSGTPIENSLSDLWSQMQFINPDILGSFDFFKKNFKDTIEKDSCEMSTLELRKIIDPFLLRRTKQEVLTELPPVMEQSLVIPMTPEQKKLFEERKSAARNNLLSLDEKDKGYKMHVFKELMALRQLANHPTLVETEYKGGSGKYEMMLNKLSSLLKAGHRVLIFSSFTSLLDLVSGDLEAQAIPYVKLTGSDTQKARQKSVAAFQEGKAPVFLISIKAGGTGLNLTEADYVFILDPWWNPFVEEQAIARAHRMGQKNKVTVIRFISEESIEEKIQVLQAKKRQLNAEIISGEGMGKLDKEEVAYLLG